jgi:hypothetical protein
MELFARTMILGLVGMAVSGGMLNAQTYPEHGPDWTYGYLQSLSSDDRIAPTCAATESRARVRVRVPWISSLRT